MENVMKTLDEILKNVADEATSRMNTPTSSSASGASDPAPATPAKRPSEAARRMSAPLFDETCKICGGAGFVLLDVPLGHPDFGKAVPCRCREQERMAKRIKSLQARSSTAALIRVDLRDLYP